MSRVHIHTCKVALWDCIIRLRIDDDCPCLGVDYTLRPEVEHALKLSALQLLLKVAQAGEECKAGTTESDGTVTALDAHIQ